MAHNFDHLADKSPTNTVRWSSLDRKTNSTNKKASLPLFQEVETSAKPSNKVNHHQRSRSVAYRPKTSPGIISTQGTSQQDNNVFPFTKIQSIDHSYVNGANWKGGPISKDHFRPARYQVAVEFEQFFGVTKAQKQELALKVKDQDGTWWYDNIEKEEMLGLLPSNPGSPTTFVSRRSSSTSDCPTSPLHTTRRRGSSFVGLGNAMSSIGVMHRLELSDGQNVSDYNYLPRSHFINIHAAKAGSRLAENNNVRRSRPVRSNSAVQRGNHIGEQWKLASLSVAEDGQSAENDILMPTFLPLPHHQATSSLLEEAFDRPMSAMSTKPHQTIENMAQGEEDREKVEMMMVATPSSLRSRLDSQGKDKPPRLDLSRTKLNSSRHRRPLSMHDFSPRNLKSSVPSSGSTGDGASIGSSVIFRDPFSGSERIFGSSNSGGSQLSPPTPCFNDVSDFPRPIRRGSSLDLPSPLAIRYRLNPQGQHQDEDKDGSATLEVDRKSPTKAALILGMNPMNANLIVPGGLRTGVHVYDGVEIPCSSVHLASDDEDDREVGSPKKKSVKSWIKKSFL